MKLHGDKVLIGGKLLPDRTVTVEDGRITAVAEGNTGDRSWPVLTAGLIDVHNHGGENFNCKDRTVDQIRPFLDKMYSCGVTDMAMTISSASRATMQRAIGVAREAMHRQKTGELGGTRILGVHLEGPFLSPARGGAMDPETVVTPSREAFMDYFGQDLDILLEMSLAPELPGADEVIACLREHGICAQAGHTDATYEQAVHAFDAGITSLCHSFNACRPIHHRDPGVVVAAMESPDTYMEAICDLNHLHPAAIRLIWREKGPDRMLIVSDSTLPHGLPDGDYLLEGYHCVVRNGVVRIASGALDGGVAYLDQAVRNLISIGIPSEEALTMATRTPAKRLGLKNLGDIAPDMKAHLVAWDENWQVASVLCEG